MRSLLPIRARAGLGMAEALISLVIVAVLLTAAAAAFKAAGDSVTQNDQYFEASQAARISLARLLTQIRCGSVDEASTSTSLHLITEDNQDITYNYDAATHEIILVTNDDTTDPDYVLARNVTQCAFDIQLGTDANNAECVASVSIEIAVKCGNNEVRFSGSAAPRRNLAY